jgi:anti-sigma28 factor (negative regulator of flagellin synthesis)
MSEVLSIQNQRVGVPIPPIETAGANSAKEARPAHGSEADRVELSDDARTHGDVESSAPIRENLVNRVRSEIAAGNYLTDEKFNVAIERMIDEVLGG